jgi:hypothetical protein
VGILVGKDLSDEGIERLDGLAQRIHAVVQEVLAASKCPHVLGKLDAHGKCPLNALLPDGEQSYTRKSMGCKRHLWCA